MYHEPVKLTLIIRIWKETDFLINSYFIISTTSSLP